jgi:Cupin domain
MNFLNLEQLPFVGMSYQFHGEKQGAPFSAYSVNAKPGTMTVGDDTRQINAGSIVVIPANVPHRFVNSGSGVLRQIGIQPPQNSFKQIYDAFG